MKTIKKEIEIFIASDGKEFLDKSKCQDHETDLRSAVIAPKEIDQRVLDIRKEWEDNPALHDEFLEKIKTQNENNMLIGVASGWFEGIDERNNPKPFPIIFSKASCSPRDTMANVLASLGLFSSVGEARKNGWNKPVTLGDHWLFKKTKRVLIVE